MREGISINKEQISGTQFAVLVYLTIVPTAILYIAGITAEETGQSAWLVPLFSLVAGFVTLWIAWKLGKRFPRHTLAQYSTIIFGKIIGKILGGSYIIFFLVFNILVIREVTDFLKISLLPSTPIWFLSLAFVLVGSYGALAGIEVLARSAEFVLPLFLFSFSIVFFTALPEMNLEELLPLLEGGLIPIIKASINPAAWLGEIIILVFLLPFINKPNEVIFKGSLSLLAVAGLLSIDAIFTLTILGSDLPSSYAVPLWKVIRYVEIGRSFLRVETLLIFLWVSAVVIKFSLIYFLGCLTTAQVFALKSHHRVVIPMGLILILAANFLVGSTIQLNEVLDKLWPPFALFFEIVMPCIFLIVAALRKKQERKIS